MSKHHSRPRGYADLPEPLPVPVYDNHTHVDPIVDEADSPRLRNGVEPLTPEEQLRRAEAVGVRGIVQVGTDPESSRWSAALAARDARVLAAVAIHPNFVVQYADAGILEDSLEEIAQLAAQPRVRAVGETGIDLHYVEPGTDAFTRERSLQRAAFARHIEIAKSTGRALQIHDRDAHEDVVDVLLTQGAPEKTVFHCFSGDVELARICNEHGWYLSFAGNVTFPSAANLRRALAVADREHILVETDAPYMAPVPNRGRPNAPYLVPDTVRFLADVLQSPVAQLAAQVAANTETVYGSWEA